MEIARGNRAAALEQLRLSEDITAAERATVVPADVGLLLRPARTQRDDARRIFAEIEQREAAGTRFGAGGWAMASLAVGDEARALEWLEDRRRQSREPRARRGLLQSDGAARERDERRRLLRQPRVRRRARQNQRRMKRALRVESRLHMTRPWLPSRRVLAVRMASAAAQREIVPVTDAMLAQPDPADWLMWRRTLDSWGYSPLDDIDRRNVARLTLAWSVDLDAAPSQEGIPLVYDGVLYFPSPSDVTTAFDAATGEKLWEHRRELPADLGQFVPFPQTNRNLAIYDRLIIDNGADDFIYALDAATGEHGLGNQDPRLQGPPREARLRAARRERRADRGAQLPAERRPRRVHHHGPRRAHGQGALAQAHDSETWRARRRQLGRRARRASAGTSAPG